MNQQSRDALVSMFLTALDGRDPTMHVGFLSGEDCVQAHNILTRVDGALKDRWYAMGEPAGEGFDESRRQDDLLRLFQGP